MSEDVPTKPSNMEEVMREALAVLHRLEYGQDMTIAAAWLTGSIAAAADADLDGLLQVIAERFKDTKAKIDRDSSRQGDSE